MLKSSLKDNIIHIWYSHIPKKELCIKVSFADIEKAVEAKPGNSNYGLYKLAEKLDYAAVEHWIGNTKKPELRCEREKGWYNDDICGKWSCAEHRVIDTIASILRTKYEQSMGKKLMGSLEHCWR